MIVGHVPVEFGDDLLVFLDPIPDDSQGIVRVTRLGDLADLVHLGSRQIRNRRSKPLALGSAVERIALFGPFISHHEEQLVANDRSREHAAILLAIELEIDGLAARGVARQLFVGVTEEGAAA